MSPRLVALCLVAACGARTNVAPYEAGAPRDAAADAPTTTARCAWTPTGRAVRLSPDDPGDAALRDAVPSLDGALVAWITPGDLQNPQTARTRRVTFDLATGDVHTALVAAGVANVLFGVSLGGGTSHLAISAFDGVSCRLRPLTLDGASNGGAAEVDVRRCDGLAATAGGFDVTLLEPRRVFSRPVDPGGAPTATAAPLFSVSGGERILATDRATSDDGSFIAIARIVSDTSARIVARHFDVRGVPLAPEHEVARPGRNALPDVSIAATPTGAVAAWGELHEHPGVAYAGLDRDGALVIVGGTAVQGRSSSITALHVAPDGLGRAVLAWIRYGDSGSEVGIHTFSARGAITEAPITLGEPIPGARFAPAVRLVAGNGVLLAIVEVSTPDMLDHAVYAMRLTCAR